MRDRFASTAPSPPPIYSTRSNAQMSEQATSRLVPTRRRAAGASGGVFARLNEPGAHMYEYVWPQPPTYSGPPSPQPTLMLDESDATARFIANVEADHESRVSRVERQEAVAAGTGASLDAENIDHHAGIEDLAESQADSSVHGSHASIGDMRSRLEEVSVYSDDSVSDASYTTAQLEQDLEDEEGPGSTKRLRHAVKIIQSITSRVEKRVGNLSKRVRTGLALPKSGEVKAVGYHLSRRDDDGNAVALAPSSDNNAAGRSRMSAPPALSGCLLSHRTRLSLRRYL